MLNITQSLLCWLRRIVAALDDKLIAQATFHCDFRNQQIVHIPSNAPRRYPSNGRVASFAPRGSNAGTELPDTFDLPRGPWPGSALVLDIVQRTLASVIVLKDNI